jgi:hypothetical protein
MYNCKFTDLSIVLLSSKAIEEDDRDGREGDYGDDDDEDRRVRLQRSSKEKARGLDAKSWLSLFPPGAKSAGRRPASVGAPEEVSADGPEIVREKRRKWSAWD